MTPRQSHKLTRQFKGLKGLIGRLDEIIGRSTFKPESVSYSNVTQSSELKKGNVKGESC